MQIILVLFFIILYFLREELTNNVLFNRFYKLYIRLTLENTTFVRAYQQNKGQIMRNDYYNMNIDDVRNVINMCEKSVVQSIAVEGYEWLIAKGTATKPEHLRLLAFYHCRGDLFNFYRINARYRKIYGLKRN